MGEDLVPGWEWGIEEYLVLVRLFAHELNNSYQVIQGYSQCALEELGPETRAHADLREVLSAADRAVCSTAGLQCLASVLRRCQAPVDLSEAVRGAEPRLRGILRAGIELDLALAPGLPACQAAPRQIDALLSALAAHGRETLSGGGRVRLSTSEAAVEPRGPDTKRELVPGRYVILSYEDSSSIGAQALLALIRDSLRASLESSRAAALAIAAGLVRQQGGSIDATDLFPQGAVLSFYFPLEGSGR